MKLLVNIPALTGQTGDTGSDLTNADFETMVSCIIQDADPDAEVKITETTLGVNDPHGIVTTAKSWNEDIRIILLAAARQILNKDADKALKMDSTDTYALTNIALTADGTFHTKSVCGIIRMLSHGRNTIAETVMSDEVLRDVIDHPENYALLNAAITIQD